MSFEKTLPAPDNRQLSSPTSPAMSRHFSAWSHRLLALAISLFTIVPLGVVMLSAFTPDEAIWQHLLSFALPELLTNTAVMLLGVSAGVLLIGVSLAWLVAVYEFPGRRLFNWGLMLPLAMPAYVLAFAQVGILEFSGPVQSLLRPYFDNMRWFPQVRSTWGLILVMSLSFYPYVYLLSRNAFATMGRRALEVGQSLGLSRREGFWRIALPMARPWIMGGLLLVVMESLADFGTVAVFNYDTFTTAVYKAWFALFSLDTAKQLASLLVLMVFVMLVLEQRSRGRRAYSQAGRGAPAPRIVLAGWHGWAAAAAASAVLLLAFVLPLLQLGYWASRDFASQFSADFLAYAWRSVLLSLLAAGLVTFLALLLCYVVRREGSRAFKLAARVATLGYAIPGTVLAVGVFVPVAWLDNQIIALMGWEGEVTAVFKGTLLAMLVAFVARFLAVAYSSVESAMNRITRSHDEAARNLGVSGWALLRRVYLPLLSGGLFSGVLMVFVDVMKEMPITLMTRPFGWDTLSVRVYNMTSEGMWDQAALPAIAIVLAGLLPVILLSRQRDVA